MLNDDCLSESNDDNGNCESLWDLNSLYKTPRIYPAEDISSDGVKAVFYEGLNYRGKPTRVFAWIGIPPEALVSKSAKVPGMVLVHGGGGTAFAEWVRLWVSRGYAAIAMDTGGHVPQGDYDNWQRHEFAGPLPHNDCFNRVGESIVDQWPYHGVADVILGHSLLCSQPQVDADRIGLTGISWGGYLSCIVAAVDKRFRFAAPVYGCGFLGDNSCWVETFREIGTESTDRWLRLWDPSVYLPQVKIPMLWVTGTNDFAYPMDSLQKSYRLVVSERTLCVRIEMPHGHGGAGENPEEIRIFADSILRDELPLPKFTGQGAENGNVWASFNSLRPVIRAELNFTTDEKKSWIDRKWQAVPAELSRQSQLVSVKLPDDTAAYYFNLIVEPDLVVSNEHTIVTAI